MSVLLYIGDPVLVDDVAQNPIYFVAAGTRNSICLPDVRLRFRDTLLLVYQFFCLAVAMFNSPLKNYCAR